jgi:hypothetical protein
LKTAGYYLLGIGAFSLILPILPFYFGGFQKTPPAPSLKVIWPATLLLSFGIAGWLLSKSDNPKDGTGHRLLMSFVSVVVGLLGTFLLAGGVFFMIEFLPKLIRGDVFR